MQKAIVLCLMQKANCLKNYDLLQIRTVTRSFDYPAVIRLNEYKNIPYKGVMLNRANIFRRDKYQCVYCGSPKQLTIDHVVPKSKGGKSTWTNLVTACHRCNVKKGDKFLEQAGMSLRIKPFKPSLSYFLGEYAEYNAEEWVPFLQVRALS